MKSLLLVLSFLTALMVVSPLATAQSAVPPDVRALESSSLTSQQINNLLYAKHAALTRCWSTDVVECRVLMKVAISVLWQESHAGALGPVGDLKNGFGRRSYGPMQVKLDSAMQMLQTDHQLERRFALNVLTVTDDELLAKLLTDQQFNISVGVTLLQYLHFTRKLSWAATVCAYNQGYANRNNEKAKKYLAQYHKGQQTPEMQAFLK